MAKYIIAGAIVLLLLYLINLYNRLIGQKEMVGNAMGQIATQIESRWDALTSLIQATKQYSQHEADILTDITKARSHISSNDGVEEVDRDDQLFNKAMGQINLVVENYPDLKASSVYQTTMNSVNDYEKNVRLSRQIYNDTVTKYNRVIKVFPNNIFSGLFGFKPEEYFRNDPSKSNMPDWN